MNVLEPIKIEKPISKIIENKTELVSFKNHKGIETYWIHIEGPITKHVWIKIGRKNYELINQL